MSAATWAVCRYSGTTERWYLDHEASTRAAAWKIEDRENAAARDRDYRYEAMPMERAKELTR